MKQFLLIGAAIALLISNTVFAKPEILVKNSKQQDISINTLPIEVRSAVKELEAKPDLYQIIVNQNKDHYVVYLLSNKTWEAEKIRIDVAQDGKVRQLIHNPQEADAVQSANVSDKCPDESVQFVAISGYPNIGAVNQAINLVSEAGKKKYKTVTVLSRTADAQTYRNWLSCPNLKVFYSIGHGTNQEIIVGKGEKVSYKFFNDLALQNKYSATTVIINSCQVYNYPFGSQLLFGNAESSLEYSHNPGPKAYQYVGGYINLLMHSSELSSACFVEKALNGAKMDYDTLKQCIGDQNLHYQSFGIAYPGKTL